MCTVYGVWGGALVLDLRGKNVYKESIGALIFCHLIYINRPLSLLDTYIIYDFIKCIQKRVFDSGCVSFTATVAVQKVYIITSFSCVPPGTIFLNVISFFIFTSSWRRIKKLQQRLYYLEYYNTVVL